MTSQPRPTADQIAQAQAILRGIPVGHRLTADQADAQQLLASAHVRRDDH